MYSQRVRRSQWVTPAGQAFIPPTGGIVQPSIDVIPCKWGSPVTLPANEPWTLMLAWYTSAYDPLPISTALLVVHEVDLVFFDGTSNSLSVGGTIVIGTSGATLSTVTRTNSGSVSTTGTNDITTNTGTSLLDLSWNSNAFIYDQAPYPSPIVATLDSTISGTYDTLDGVVGGPLYMGQQYGSGSSSAYSSVQCGDAYSTTYIGSGLSGIGTISVVPPVSPMVVMNALLYVSRVRERDGDADPAENDYVVIHDPLTTGRDEVQDYLDLVVDCYQLPASPSDYSSRSWRLKLPGKIELGQSEVLLATFSFSQPVTIVPFVRSRVSVSDT